MSERNQYFIERDILVDENESLRYLVNQQYGHPDFAVILPPGGKIMVDAFTFDFERRTPEESG